MEIFKRHLWHQCRSWRPSTSKRNEGSWSDAFKPQKCPVKIGYCRLFLGGFRNSEWWGHSHSERAMGRCPSVMKPANVQHRLEPGGTRPSTLSGPEFWLQIVPFSREYLPSPPTSTNLNFLSFILSRHDLILCLDPILLPVSPLWFFPEFSGSFQPV